MNLPKAIKFCRLQRGLSQSDLASKAEISISYLSLLERGKRDPVMSTLVRIASALKMPLVLLLFIASSNEEKAIYGTILEEKMSYLALKTFEN